MQTLYEAVAAKGYSKKGFAKLMGWSRPTLRKYALSPDAMRVQDVKKACDLLGVEREVSVFLPEKVN